MWRLEKKGTFTLSCLPGNACGGEGSHTFSYVFTAETVNLNSRGFVVEHVEASAAIETWARRIRWKGSCEQVVDSVGRVILPHLAELKSWIRFTVQVTRNGNATITRASTLADWRNTNPLGGAVAIKRKAKRHGR